MRVRDSVQARLQSHDQEVCGLKWSPSGNQLASGGNDNMLYVWDQHSIGNGTHLHQLAEHKAAVKALAWCPFQSNLLASGGGTADRCIKFWNTHTGACLNSIDTHSQVCALQWNRHERELLSSHGFSQNQLCLWKYPTMTKMAELTGHTARVLHLAQSPDGATVVSYAADETQRIWRVFAPPERSNRTTLPLPLGHYAVDGKGGYELEILELRDAKPSSFRMDASLRLQAAANQRLPPPVRFVRLWSARGAPPD